MDLLRTKKATVLLFSLIVLLSCVQAVPVIKDHTDITASKESGIQDQGTNTNGQRDSKNSLDNKNDNQKNIIPDNSNNNNIRPQSFSPSWPLLLKGQGQNPVTPALPLLESLQPLVKRTGNDNSQTGEISKEFTRKVLQAFFNELKNRPDLVDEILKRETYKLLMSIAQEDNEYSSIPQDMDLTQELVPEPVLHREEPEADDSENPTPITETVLPQGKEITKKSTQENDKTESLKTQSSIPNGDRSPSQASKIQAELTKQLDKIGLPSMVNLKNADTPSQNKADNGLSQQPLIDPYYYYVYYDENEVPNSGSSDKKEDGHQSPIPNGNKNGDKGTPKVDTVNGNHQTLAENNPTQNVPSPITDKTHDVVVDKIALAVRSIITRDMEKQLAKSKLALNNNLVPNYNTVQALSSLPEVKVASADHQKGTQTANQSADEETELRNLTQP